MGLVAVWIMTSRASKAREPRPSSVHIGRQTAPPGKIKPYLLPAPLTVNSGGIIGEGERA